MIEIIYGVQTGRGAAKGLEMVKKLVEGGEGKRKIRLDGRRCK